MSPGIDYAAEQAAASDMIADFGRDMTLRSSDGSPDQTVTAILFDYGTRSFYSARAMSLVQPNDKRCFIAAKNGVVPDAEKHTMLVDGLEYRMIHVRPVRPADTVIYFDCQVRT